MKYDLTITFNCHICDKKVTRKVEESHWGDFISKAEQAKMHLSWERVPDNNTLNDRYVCSKKCFEGLIRQELEHRVNFMMDEYDKKHNEINKDRLNKLRK